MEKTFEETLKLVLEHPGTSLATSSISLLETMARKADLAQAKAKKWDELDDAVGKFYEEDDQISDDDYTEEDGGGDLLDIGELCARKLGYL